MSRTAVVTCAALVAACGGGGGGGGGGNITPTQPPGGTATPVLTTILVPTTSVVSAAAPTAGTIQLTASARDQFGNPIDANISWSSSAPTIADVSATGLVTGISAGTAIATAASGSVRASTPITVTGGGTFPIQAAVQMPSNTFTPGQIDIALNGVVSFVFPADQHNVIFTGGANRPADIQVTNNATVARQFPSKGAYPFVCTLHPGMQSAVVVH